MLSVQDVRYDLVVVLPTGDTASLAPVLGGLSWEEQPGDVAVRVTADVADTTLPGQGTTVRAVVAPGARVVVRADLGDGAGFVSLVAATVVDWRYTDAERPTVTITAYDDLFWLSKSEDEYLWEAGTGLNVALAQVFADWGLPAGAIETPDVPLPKVKHQGPLDDLVHQLLTVAYDQSQVDYVVRARLDDGGQTAVDVVGPGQNAPKWHLRSNESVVDYDDQQSIADLVTEVRIIGADAEDGGLRIADDPEGQVPGMGQAPGTAPPPGLEGLGPIPGSDGGAQVAWLPDATRQRWAVDARRAAVREGIDPLLFDRQMRQENGNYAPDVISGQRVSSAGARGIAQFMPATGNAVAAQLGVPAATFWADPATQLAGAARLMATNLSNYGGDWTKALSAYNAGPNGNWNNAETRNYVAVIMAPNGPIHGIPPSVLSAGTAGVAPGIVQDGPPPDGAPGAGDEPAGLPIVALRPAPLEAGGEEPAPEDEPVGPRPPLDGVLRLDRYVDAGIRLRRLVAGQQNDSPATLQAEAAALLAEQGAPRRVRTLTAPDVPTLRRGDAVVVTAGTMNGEVAAVAGVAHDADRQQMTLTIDSSGMNPRNRARVDEADASRVLQIEDDPTGLVPTFPGRAAEGEAA